MIDGRAQGDEREVPTRQTLNEARDYTYLHTGGQGGSGTDGQRSGDEAGGAKSKAYLALHLVSG